MPVSLQLRPLYPQHTPVDVPLRRGLGSACGRSEGASKGAICAGYLCPLCPLSHRYSRPGQSDKKALSRGPGREPAGLVCVGGWWEHHPCRFIDPCQRQTGGLLWGREASPSPCVVMKTMVMMMASAANGQNTHQLQAPPYIH